MPPRLIRAVAVGNRIHLAAAVSEASWIAELERIAALAGPHLAPDRPNLLVLGEVLGLPGALAGPRGILARRARRSQTALTLLALALLPRILACRRRWPGLSLPRALLLASADALYRPVAETLARVATHTGSYVVATTLAPHLRRSDDPHEIARWGRRGRDYVYVPTGPEVYNAALVFGPDGTLLGRVDKVNLTESEAATLDLTPGRLEDVRVIPTAAGRLGVAISLDAFTPTYLRHLDAQGAEIVVQPDANDQPWAAPSKTSAWQPAEWLSSVLGSIQPTYTHLRHNVCAMQTGNFFDIAFDGQSTITTRADTPPDTADRAHGFVGVDDYRDIQSGLPLLGRMLAVAPWVVPDPIVDHPNLNIAERRRRLAAISRALLPGGARAGDYRESVIAADLSLTPDNGVPDR